MSITQSRRGSALTIVSFADVVRLWPSRHQLAADCAVHYQTVVSWERRSSIPECHWEGIERSAERLHIHGITYDYLRSVAATHAEHGGPHG